MPDDQVEAITTNWQNDDDGLKLSKLTELPELEPENDQFGGGGGGFRGSFGGGGFRGRGFQGRGGGNFRGNSGGGGGFRGRDNSNGFRGRGLKRSFNSMPDLQRATKVLKFE